VETLNVGKKILWGNATLIPYVLFSLQLGFPEKKFIQAGLHQWCTGSGFWSPIRPDISNFLDLDWISFPFQLDPEPDYPNEKTVAM